MENKKAQTFIGMSFSVIFSIIIIIFILVVGFFVIRSILETGDCAKLKIFIEDFEEDIKKAWNSDKVDFSFKGALPVKLDYICFADLSKKISGEHEDIGEKIDIYEGTGANLFFYPKENSCGMPYYEIKYLNIDKITENKNPYCIPVRDGEISIKLKKGFDEVLVNIE